MCGRLSFENGSTDWADFIFVVSVIVRTRFLCKRKSEIWMVFFKIYLYCEEHLYVPSSRKTIVA